MNLWSYLVFQNRNKKVPMFLPSLHKAEILTIFFFVFWKKRWLHKFILKFTDLYWICPICFQVFPFWFFWWFFSLIFSQFGPLHILWKLKSQLNCWCLFFKTWIIWNFLLTNILHGAKENFGILGKPALWKRILWIWKSNSCAIWFFSIWSNWNRRRGFSS